MGTATACRIQRPALLFSAALLLLSGAASSQDPPVLDSDGNPVRVGALYRLKHAGIGFFGGVTVFPPANETTCSRPIGLGDETDPGLPVRIKPGSASQAPGGVLRVSVRSRIEIFPELSPGTCADPGVWTTVEANSSGTGRFTAVVAGRGPGTPPDTLKWFEVRETGKERVYKLIYCPACLLCDILCLEEVGLFDVGGKIVLGVGGEAFAVRFVKIPLLTPAAAAS